MRELHRLRRRFELEACPDAVHRLRVRLARMIRPLRDVKDALQHLRWNGSAVRARAGVGRARQLADQLRLAWLLQLPPRDYYQYRLYLPGRMRDAGAWLHQEHAIRLARSLHPPLGYPPIWDKRDFARRCRHRALPTLPILAEFEAGRRTGPPQTERGIEDGRDLYAKPAQGFHGYGILLWRALGEGRYRGDDGAVVARAEIEERLRRVSETAGAFVLQPRVDNHPEFGPLSNGALCTLRITACRFPDGRVETVLPALRMPVGDSVVDNFRQGNLLAGVDPETGCIRRAILRDRRGLVTEVTVHPDSGCTLPGFAVPRWTHALALARRAQQAFVEYAFVGWDVAVTPDGPVLVEGNLLFGSEAPQLAHDLPLGATPLVECMLAHARVRLRTRAPRA